MQVGRVSPSDGECAGAGAEGKWVWSKAADAAMFRSPRDAQIRTGRSGQYLSGFDLILRRHLRPAQVPRYRRPLGMTRVLIEITQMATLSICPHAGPGVRRRVVGAAWAGAGQQAGCRDAHQPGEAVRGRSRPGSHAVHACCSCMLFMHAVHACCSYG